MRGELFKENEIKDSNVEVNPYISQDLMEIQEHYSILLEYVKLLESRNTRLKHKNERLEREVKEYEKKFEQSWAYFL